LLLLLLFLFLLLLLLLLLPPPLSAHTDLIGPWQYEDEFLESALHNAKRRAAMLEHLMP
jgi:hypothetical protein